MLHIFASTLGVGIGLASIGDIDAMVCHPGGAKVLAALESAFELGDSPLAEARSVLSHYGNMSAATVMFVLKDVLRTRTRGRLLMTALGPGFTAGFLLVEGADASSAAPSREAA